MPAGRGAGPAGAGQPGGVPHPSFNTVVFGCTGGTETWVVPPGLHSVVVDVAGAQGGEVLTPPAGYHAPPPGLGGYVRAVLNVTAGQVLYINVGGQGESPPPTTTAGGAGGFNGGGDGGNSPGIVPASLWGGQDHPAYGSGGPGGGGASDVSVQLRGNVFQRVVVAGGGGAPGGGFWGSFGYPSAGGGGGGTTGGDAGDLRYGPVYGGGGAGPTSGGTGGTPGGWMGSWILGGSGASCPPNTVWGGGGGGGGGGWYGGGGGGSATLATGGGGGSGWYATVPLLNLTGVQAGEGSIMITHR